MNSNRIAIDVHSHINHGVPGDSSAEKTPIYSAKLDWLRQVNLAAGIDKMLCSPAAAVTTGSNARVPEENEYMFRLAREVDYLYQWVVIEPRIDETFVQADRMLKTDKCVGVKLHPLYHKYELEQYADPLFSFASRHRAIVQIHATAEDADRILPIADKYPDVTFIMAHLGGKPHVDAIDYAKHGNVYTDTSGIASSRNKLLEYAVERVGSERILFGTDTYAAGFQRGRVDYALISDEDKENILFRNAQRLFGERLR